MSMLSARSFGAKERGRRKVYLYFCARVKKGAETATVLKSNQSHAPATDAFKRTA